MPRPKQCRFVGALPKATFYKPRGVPLSALENVTLTIAEFEAIRLCDLEGMYQVQAALKIKVSRQTLGRMLGSAHRKIADAMVNGKSILIEGGPYELDTAGRYGGGHGEGRGRKGRGRGPQSSQ